MSVYNFKADDESGKGKRRDGQYESIFDSFSGWIVQDTMTRQEKKDRHRDGIGHNGVGDVLRLVAAYEYLSSTIFNNSVQGEQGWKGRHARGNKNRVIEGKAKKVFHHSIRNVPARGITMLANAEDTTEICLLATYASGNSRKN